jgi:hypothetical protein
VDLFCLHTLDIFMVDAPLLMTARKALNAEAEFDPARSTGTVRGKQARRAACESPIARGMAKVLLLRDGWVSAHRSY